MYESSMRYNAIGNIQGELFIGTNAGKRLLRSIKNAEKSICVISPYISESLLTILTDKMDRGVNTILVTEQFYPTSKSTYKATCAPTYAVLRNHISKFIVQHPQPILAGIAQREKMHKRASYFRAVGIVCALMAPAIILYLILVALQSKDTPLKLTPTFPIGFLAFILCCFGSVLSLRKSYGTKLAAHRIPVTEYSYEQISPFRLVSPDTTNSLHAKIYIIDDKVAYLGSLNFTEWGTEHNVEIILAVEDPETIRAIKNACENIYNDCTAISSQEIGRNCYPETPWLSVTPPQ